MPKAKAVETPKEVIMDEIGLLVCRYYGSTNWYEYKKLLQTTLDNLDPALPKDGKLYYIAFNVAKEKPKQTTRTGRFIVKKLGLLDMEIVDSSQCYVSIDNSALEYLAGRINLRLFGIEKTEILRGSDITEAYRQNVGTPSCMTGSCCEYTRLYECNPDRFGLCVMYASNNSARAVFHTLDNGKHLLDRVYSNCELLKEKMHAYAIENGWYYHLNGNVTLDDKQQKGEVLETIKSSNLEYQNGGVPYMDTLFKGEIKDGLLNIMYDGGDFCLDSTCGEIDNYIECEDCGESIYSDDAYYNDGGGYYICSRCYNSNYYQCGHCCSTHHKRYSFSVSGQSYLICGRCRSSYIQCPVCSKYSRESSAYDKCLECFEKEKDSIEYIQYTIDQVFAMIPARVYTEIERRENERDERVSYPTPRIPLISRERI